MILAISSATLLKEQLATMRGAKSFQGYMRAERQLRNQMEAKEYAQAGKKEKSSSIVKRMISKQNIAYVSPREKQNPHDASKLNLAPLFSAEKLTMHSSLYQTASRLICSLYSHAPFFKEAKSKISNLENRLLDYLIEKGKQNPSWSSFTDFFQERDLLGAVFYKMLQGTNSYDIPQKRGYPPFEDFFILDQKRKAVSFCFASAPLLTALFDEPLSQLIREEEKKKWEKNHTHRTLKQSELEQLLLKSAPNGNLQMSTLKGWVSFSRTSGGRLSSAQTDKETGITVRRKEVEGL